MRETERERERERETERIGIVPAGILASKPQPRANARALVRDLMPNQRYRQPDTDDAQGSAPQGDEAGDEVREEAFRLLGKPENSCKLYFVKEEAGSYP